MRLFNYVYIVSSSIPGLNETYIHGVFFEEESANRVAKHMNENSKYTIYYVEKHEII